MTIKNNNLQKVKKDKSVTFRISHEDLPKLPWMDQPSLNQPYAVTMAYTVDSLL